MHHSKKEREVVTCLSEVMRERCIKALESHTTWHQNQQELMKHIHAVVNVVKHAGCIESYHR